MTGRITSQIARVFLGLVLVFAIFGCQDITSLNGCRGSSCASHGHSAAGLRLTADVRLLDIADKVDPDKLGNPKYLADVQARMQEALNQGASPAAVNAQQKNAFHLLAGKPNTAGLVNYLVASSGSDGILAADSEGRRPLTYAQDPVVRDALILASSESTEFLATMHQRLGELEGAVGKLSDDYLRAIPVVAELSERDPGKLQFLLGNNKTFVYKDGQGNWVSITNTNGKISKSVSPELQAPASLWAKQPARVVGVGAGEGGAVIIAHRGGGPTAKLSGGAGKDVPGEYAPENTRKSFLSAFSQGADGFEFDIHVSREGIPMVIHGDKLNMYVAGVDRSGSEQGLVSEKTVDELRALNVGQGEKIPSLQEILDLTAQENRLRALFGQNDLIMNIELKGKDSGPKTAELVAKAVKDKRLNGERIIYCSFQYDELKALKTTLPDAKLTPGLRTEFTFGDANVDSSRGWYVAPNVTMTKQAMATLENMHKTIGLTGIDAPLFDIDPSMIEFARRNGLQIHASSSSLRDLDARPEVLDFLMRASYEVPVYFKTDEPLLARRVMNTRAMAWEALKVQGITTIESQPMVRLIKPGTGSLVEDFYKVNPELAPRGLLGSPLSPEGRLSPTKGLDGIDTRGVDGIRYEGRPIIIDVPAKIKT